MGDLSPALDFAFLCWLHSQVGSLDLLAKMVPCSPKVSSHQSSGEFLLLNNSSKSLGVESQGLSLGHMTMTEAIAMISLVMCMSQPQEPWVGLGRRKALAAKIRDTVYMRGNWGNGTWLSRRGLVRVSGETSELQSLASLARGIGSQFHQA